jgi:hypothetical protein
MTLNEKVIAERWIGKDVEGSGHGLIIGTITLFAWRVWEKPWKWSG